MINGLPVAGYKINICGFDVPFGQSLQNQLTMKIADIGIQQSDLFQVDQPASKTPRVPLFKMIFIRNGDKMQKLEFGIQPVARKPAKAISSPSSEVPDISPMPSFSGFWAMANRFCRF